MNPLPPLLFTLLAAGSLPAQIYADFTVSHGDTPLGTFRAELAWDKAPRPVAHFVGLATGQRPWIDTVTGKVMTNTPFYDGSHFQRLDHNFVIQGGDPPGKEGKRPGYTIQDQFHADLRHSGRYMLSFAKANTPHTTGGQFFITLGRASVPIELRPLAALDDKHSVFGEVISGKELIDNFANPTLFPVNPGTETPSTRITMDSVVISGPSLASFDLNDPALRLPTVRHQQFKPSYDPDTNAFGMEWDWGVQTDNFISYSTDLESLTPFQHILSLDANPASEFTINGATFESFFVELVEIDYSLLPNAPDVINGEGSILTLTDRDGATVTLTFDGGTGGTWSDSLGNSGDLSGVAWFDRRGSTGFIQSSPLQSNPARNLPLGGLELDFDGPAGPSGWTFLSVNLSFHEEQSGFLQGGAAIAGGSEPVLWAFAYAP